MDNLINHQLEEKIIKPMNGIAMLIICILMMLLFTPVLVIGATLCGAHHIGVGILLIVLSIAMLFFGILFLCGLHQVNPNEALVLVCFGKYHGTVKNPGYYFVNPFARPIVPSSTLKAIDDSTMMAIEDVGKKNKKTKSVAPPRKRVSLKVNTLNNDKQKVNDSEGNPIIIGSSVIWKVINPTQAVFNVEDYSDFLSTQCDLVIRNVARMYPYDNFNEGEAEASNEKTLRGSSQEIADIMQNELQKRVENAGLEIIDVRLSNLAYAEEIAAAMLQRQQASAIIAARQKIVEGAVGMVKMALDQLDEDGVVVLDDERKAAMVSNLLVVLCGNKDAQPVINNGSIY